MSLEAQFVTGQCSSKRCLNITEPEVMASSGKPIIQKLMSVRHAKHSNSPNKHVRKELTKKLLKHPYNTGFHFSLYNSRLLVSLVNTSPFLGNTTQCSV